MTYFSPLLQCRSSAAMRHPPLSKGVLSTICPDQGPLNSPDTMPTKGESCLHILSSSKKRRGKFPGVPYCLGWAMPRPCRQSDIIY